MEKWVEKSLPNHSTQLRVLKLFEEKTKFSSCKASKPLDSTESTETAAIAAGTAIR